MSGMTPEVIAALRAPFAVEDHELRDGGRDGKLVYITEEPLVERLTDIDPNWQFRIVSTHITDYNLTRPDSATVTGELTLLGVTRAGVGTCVANLQSSKWVTEGGKNVKKNLETPIILPLSETEIKGAATDALKRAARMFGIGAYLLRTKGVKFNSDADFAAWYRKTFAAPSAKTTPPETPAPKSAPAPEAPVSELDAHLGPKEIAEAAKSLARSTCPWDASVQKKSWQEFMVSAPQWSKKFWPGVAALGLDEDMAHHALNVESVKTWNGEGSTANTVGHLWYALACAAVEAVLAAAEQKPAA